MSKDIRYYFGSNQSKDDNSPTLTENKSNENIIKLEAFTDGSAINNGKKIRNLGIRVFFLTVIFN